MNPLQFRKHLSAFRQRSEDEYKRADILNHALGQYISFAFNDPKKYPREPFSVSYDVKQLEPQTDQQMERMAKINTMMLGGVVQ